MSAMMQNLTEKLIEYVKEYSILYDLSHLEYKNIRKKNKVWGDIGKLLEVDGNGVSLKMPPRLSARRIFIFVVIFFFVTILLSINQIFWYPHKTRLQETNIEVADFEENINVASVVDDNLEQRFDEELPPTSLSQAKPWFMAGGTIYPTNSKGPSRLFPDQADGDRIVDQLMYVPEDYQGDDAPEKVILAYNGLSVWGQSSGSAKFHECPVNRCTLTSERSKATTADAILYKDHFIHPGVARPSNQVWIIYFLECPYHTPSVKFPDLINWTATYRRDSDIVAPYERWTYHNPQVKQKVQSIDYAANKTKKVAWFVSNCGARNGRLVYARELAKHIPVDIYGNCGPLKCPRSDKKCFELLNKDYKFYLAFENSNCRDYLTEKFFVNGLGQGILPIVMGGRPEDYQKSAPEGSYIHVDEFSSPAELAAYLHRLDQDSVLFNSYFKWKGTGEFINTYFWCRLCAMLHAPIVPRHYEDVNDWWRGPGVCTAKSWRNAEFV